MERDKARDQLIHTITTVLAEHPDLAGEASQAITLGVTQGVHKMQTELMRCRNAMNVSLVLLQANRVNDDLRQLLYQQVAQAIPKSNQTSAEQQFLEKLNV